MTELVEQLTSGDARAWDEFVRKFGAIIYAAVRRTLLHNVPDMETAVQDASQEVFIKLIKNDYRLLRNYDRSRAAPSTFLTIVARSATIDWLRSRKRLAAQAQIGPEALEAIPAPQAPEAPDIDIPEDLLSPRQRLVMRLLFDEHYSVAEAANFLGVEQQTIRSAKHKALIKLRKHFQTPSMAGEVL